ncbi:MAG: serine hydrolase [Anaerolineae bacterium]|nr:serine hydrolase [Anaerolineae bacterium]
MSQERFEKVVQLVQKVVETYHVPGAALGMVNGDQMYTAGVGVTNMDHPLPVTDETLFQIGSVTKTFTTTAIMRLVEMGKLDLNAPVRRYLPNFRVADESVSALVTVRHLVTHSGGWDGDVFTDTGANDDALALFVEKMAGLVQLAPPDTLFSYNNSAFAVAGLLVETAMGKPYESAMKELVLDPLGLTRSFYFPRDLMTFRFAVGHVVIENAARVQRPWAIPRSSNAAGGLTCHVRDLLSYARFHMGDGTAADGTRLLSPESIQLMQTPQFPINNTEGYIGLSWLVTKIGGVKLIQHSGGTLGQVCVLVIAPEQSFALAILTNADYGGLAVKAGTELALKEFLDVEIPVPAIIPAAEGQLEDYVGKYANPSMNLEITQQGDGLEIRISEKLDLQTEQKAPELPPIKLALCGEDQLIATDGIYKDARLELIRKADGSIGWVRLGGRIHNRVG